MGKVISHFFASTYYYNFFARNFFAICVYITKLKETFQSVLIDRQFCKKSKLAFLKKVNVVESILYLKIKKLVVLEYDQFLIIKMLLVVK